LAADRTATQKETIPPIAIVISLVLALGIAGFVFLDRASKQPPSAPPPLTEDGKAYVRNLKLSNVEMKAHESYLKQSVTEIVGDIMNGGDRPLKSVELNCVFFDPYGQVVLRQRVPIVSAKAGGLTPGETKSFRLPFDNIPESWNNLMPQLVIAGISFQ
jgi:Protein of unknown function (DUF3426)